MSTKYTINSSPYAHHNRNTNMGARHHQHPHQQQQQRQRPGMRLLRRIAGRGGPSNSSTQHPSGAVGTQAKALENIQMNAHRFKYPKAGFVTAIEHSLLYSMISEPKIYPEDVVLQHINEEDFDVYLHVNNHSNDKRMDTTSYAQLSALLVLSAEKFPPKDANSSSATNSPSNNNNSSTSKPSEYDDDYHDDHDRFCDDADDPTFRSRTSSTKKNTASQAAATTTDDDKSIPMLLCKRIMKYVIQYSEDNDLDRKIELEELLKPVQEYNISKQNKTFVPMYIAYATGLLIPGGIGLGITMLSLGAILSTTESITKETQNVESYQKESNRRGDIEKVSLLDEEC